MKLASLSVLAMISLIITIAILIPSPIDPIAWEAPKRPELKGIYQKNEHLAKAEILFSGECNKCEDVAIDKEGRIYGGSVDGDIIVFDKGQRAVLANTGGRPLGLHFDTTELLIVADADKGLLSIDDKGKITVLVDEYEGKKFKFADDLEVAADNTIYFSDASTKFGFGEHKLDILENRGNGRLFSYHPATGSTKLLLEDLHFANGIAVAHDQSFVLVNETGKYRTQKYWLKGPKAGTAEIFINNLPGMPDGISQGDNGIFWLALVTPRLKSVDDISANVFMKKMVSKLPEALQPKPKRYGFVLGLDGEGKVVYNFQDPSGKYAEITSVQQDGSFLYLGSLVENGIARYQLEE